MAKRRKLEAPSAEDMGRIEEEFRRETPQRSPAAPIAQVAADTANAFQAGSPETRRDEAQAAAYRKAEGQGLLIKQVSLDEIDVSAMQRDRTIMDEDALEELEHSIKAHGLRLPIEVYALASPVGGKRYGLLSGHRRFVAQQNLYAGGRHDAFGRIKAIIRDPQEIGGAFVAMVEENEIRQDLSHYERGRIAVIAAQQGAFASTETAVAQMFAAASKAKRSKIRSFAMIFEELGDVLRYAEGLREKDGLRLAQALRGGATGALRDVLATATRFDAASEWAVIDQTLKAEQTQAKDPSRGGRPSVTKLQVGSSLSIETEKDDDGFVIRIRGKDASAALMKKMLRSIKSSLE